MLPSGPDPYLSALQPVGDKSSPYGKQTVTTNNPYIGKNNTYLGKTTLALHQCLQDSNHTYTNHNTSTSTITTNKNKQFNESMEQQRQKEEEEEEDEDVEERLNNMTLKEALLNLHKDEQLAEWQEFCVNTVTVTKNGAHMSLPVLNRGFTGEGSGSTSSSAKGKLVYIPSVLDYEVKGPSSYLDLYTTKSKIQHNYNQHKK